MVSGCAKKVCDCRKISSTTLSGTEWFLTVRKRDVSYTPRQTILGKESEEGETDRKRSLH